MILVTKWFGCFLCQEGKVKRASLFPKSAVDIADRLARINRGEVLDEELELASSAEQVVDPRLAEFGKVVRLDSSFIRPEDFEFTLELYREATIILAKESVKASIGPDIHLGQAVRAYDDLVFTTNLLSERLREWYGLHFPELEVVLGAEAYSRAVTEHGTRGEITESLALKMDSIGSDIDPQDLDSVRSLGRALVQAYSSRSEVERYIDARMGVVAPNISSLVGPVVGARLMTQAGSLKRLASMPSSTIQLLGAEKAMFRHLKKGNKPPKHGTLFQHPLVHDSPVWQRGAIARALASKICLAARADMYTKSNIGPVLRTQLDKRVEQIREQHSAPRKRKAGKGKKRRK